MGRSQQEWIAMLDRLFDAAASGEDIPRAAFFYGWRGRITAADMAWASKQLADPSARKSAAPIAPAAVSEVELIRQIGSIADDSAAIHDAMVGRDSGISTLAGRCCDAARSIIASLAKPSAVAAPIAPVAQDHQARKLYQGRAAYDFIKRGTFQTDGFAVTVAGHVIAECEDSEVADWISKQWNAAERKETGQA
jgi:hypothetical protein